MKQMTRNIDPGDARDLLERAPHACLCFTGKSGPQAQPVRFMWQDGRYLVGVPHAGLRPDPGQEAVLLIDEGIYFFDLRAIYVRGQVEHTPAPAQNQAARVWYEIIPRKTVAWDYGTLREVQTNGSQ